MKFLLALAILAVSATFAQDENAALIVGGYWYYDDGDAIKDKVELFCPNGQSVELTSAQYPKPTYLAGGVLFQDGRVISCGGYGCDENNVCETNADCYWLSKGGNWDGSAADLLEPRFNFLMASVYHKDYSGQGRLPLSIGYGFDTEIYNKRDGEWQIYYQLEDRNWYSQGCLIDYNDRIYSMRDEIFELNPYEWTTNSIHVVPTNLARSGKCAGLTIDGAPGIFTRYGYWFDINAKNWTKKASPPVEPLAGTTNVMWSYNGKPTIFGNPACDNTGDCQNKLIMQYDEVSDSWSQIGEMVYPRIYQTVIEVPRDWCDEYGVTDSTTTTTTTATTSGAATIASGVVALMAPLAFLLARN